MEPGLSYKRAQSRYLASTPSATPRSSLSPSICLGPAPSKEARMRLSKRFSPAPLTPADDTSPHTR